MSTEKIIKEGKTALGIELGSTRVKAVLISLTDHKPIASGSHDWENRFESGIWTYRLDDVSAGLQASYKNLAADVKERYGITLTTAGAIGISAMMHGYLAFDKDDKQLAQFRTWRNTTTEKAAAELTEKLQFNIPLRWSIAHLYQAMLNKEEHVKNISFITTLAGYVHWKLTGNKVIGIGDASGMFPVSSGAFDFDSSMIKKFNDIASPYKFYWNIKDIHPKVLNAGDDAESLTEEGALFLDPSGKLNAGIPLCPPEGDAGTGMVATNAVTERTGNISAGTSIFAMIVMEKNLSKVYPEIDIVATPSGKAVAMVHGNNCTSDIDAWLKLFREVADISLPKGAEKISKTAFYEALYFKSLEADSDCGKLLAYNFFSGEPLAGVDEGRPLFARLPDSGFTLANFMRTILFSALGTLKLGIDILEKEQVKIDSLLGHGGLFKTKEIGQRYMAAAFNAPVSVMEGSAAEGGAWGIALLAAYTHYKKNAAGTITLEKFLNENVFKNFSSVKIDPYSEDVKSFNLFMERYTAGLKIEKSAIDNFKR